MFCMILLRIGFRVYMFDIHKHLFYTYYMSDNRKLEFDMFYYMYRMLFQVYSKRIGIPYPLHIPV